MAFVSIPLFTARIKNALAFLPIGIALHQNRKNTKSKKRNCKRSFFFCCYLLVSHPFRQRAKFGDLSYTDLDLQRIKAKRGAVMVRGNYAFLFANTIFSVKDLLAVFTKNAGFFQVLLFSHTSPILLLHFTRKDVFLQELLQKRCAKAHKSGKRKPA